MPVPATSLTDPLASGDLIVAAAEDGTFQVLRVGGNGRAEHVLGYQRTEAAALDVAWRAAAGGQRVFVRPVFGSRDSHAVRQS